jgi:hypothetical protein
MQLTLHYNVTKQAVNSPTADGQNGQDTSKVPIGAFVCQNVLY